VETIGLNPLLVLFLYLKVPIIDENPCYMCVTFSMGDLRLRRVPYLISVELKRQIVYFILMDYSGAIY